MIQKYFLSLLLAVSLVSTASADALFPRLFDPAGYDALEDSMTFQVRGTFFHVGPSNVSITTGDSMLGLYSITAINGVALPANTFAAVVLSADVGAGDIAVQSTRVGFRLTDAIPGANLTAFTAGNIANASAAFITSTTLNFASIPLTSLNTPAGFQSQLSGSNYQVEALFSIGEGYITGAKGTFPAEFGLTSLQNTFNTNFIPVLATGSGLSNPSDFFIGSNGVLGGGTALNTNAGVGATGNLSGSAFGLTNPIPEPGMILTVMSSLGIGGLAVYRRKRALAA